VNTKFSSRVDARDYHEPCSVIDLAINMNKIHFFDKQTEEVITIPYFYTPIFLLIYHPPPERGLDKCPGLFLMSTKRERKKAKKLLPAFFQSRFYSPFSWNASSGVTPSCTQAETDPPFTKKVAFPSSSIVIFSSQLPK